MLRLAGEAVLTSEILEHADFAAADRLIERASAAGFEVDTWREFDRLRQTGTFCLRREEFHLDVILASLPFGQESLHRARIRKLIGRSVPSR